jgi:Tfp pilus assembly protein PilO
MRAFVLALVAVAVLATGWWFSLNALQETAAQAMTTGSARLDQQEAVNAIGRES